MYKSILLTLVSLSLIACFPDPPDGGGGGGGGGTPDAGGGNPCTRRTASTVDGFPFDVATFDSMLYTPLKGCEIGGGCHGAGNPNRFTVYSTGECPDIKTFNELFALSDYMLGATESRIVKAINGTLAAHPVKPPGTDSLVTTLTSYIDTAKTTFDEGGGGGGGGDAAFDRGVFASQIQPVVDNVGCIGGCHNATSGSPFGNFALTPNARAGSPELEANVQAFLAKIDLTLDPAQARTAKIYVKATDRHGPVISDATALGNLETWISTGLMGQ